MYVNTGSMALRVREGEGVEGPRGARARLVAPFQHLVLYEAYW